MEIERHGWQGHDAWRLNSSTIEVVVLPDLGGKLISLRDRRADREWLWRNPHLPLRPTEGEVDYVGRCDFGGWDEILPTVAPCRVSGSPWGEAELVDHGELWRRPWRGEESGEGELLLTLEPDALPFAVTRRLRIDGESLTCAYTVKNRSEAPLPYLWAAHPLLAIEPGMRIEASTDSDARCAGGVNSGLQDHALSFDWPHLPQDSGATLDLSDVPDRSAGYAIKAFVHSSGGVRVCEPVTGASLAIACREHPWFGLWMNYGAWSGAGTPAYFNLGVEPTTHPCDALEEALGHDGGGPVPPLSERTWSVELTLRVV